MDNESSAVAVAEPDETTTTAVEEKGASKRKTPKRQPRYNVILWNDDDHTFEYVIRMMKQLFGYVEEKGKQIAKEVDTSGRAICMTTTMELAELKRDQIHAFGRDVLSLKSKGSMSATIEPVPE
jgi:ATP-dependent Clp protease adaptor protein ClpS